MLQSCSSLSSPSRPLRLKSLAPFTPPIAIVVALIHSRFIHVHSLEWWESYYLSHESGLFASRSRNRGIFFFSTERHVRQRTRDVRSLISPLPEVAPSLLCVCRRRFWQSYETRPITIQWLCPGVEASCWLNRPVIALWASGQLCHGWCWISG